MSMYSSFKKRGSLRISPKMLGQEVQVFFIFLLFLSYTKFPDEYVSKETSPFHDNT
jgi:hypothetical protein